MILRLKELMEWLIQLISHIPKCHAEWICLLNIVRGAFYYAINYELWRAITSQEYGTDCKRIKSRICRGI